MKIFLVEKNLLWSRKLFEALKFLKKIVQPLIHSSFFLFVRAYVVTATATATTPPPPTATPATTATTPSLAGIFFHQNLFFGCGCKILLLLVELSSG